MSERTRRIRTTDTTRRHGALPGSRTPPPLLTLRRRGCNDRLARVYVTPDGFHVLGDEFTLPPDEFIAREHVDSSGAPVVVDGLELTLGNWQAGRFVIESRAVSGVDRVLPADITGWDAAARFELGCKHAHGWMQVDDLRDRVAAAGRAGRERRKPPASAEYVDLT